MPNAAAAGTGTAAMHPMSLGWVMKRTALGLLILAIAMGSIAWLTYASIDQSAAVTIPANLAP